MKKLLLLLFTSLILISCSSESDETEEVEMCCQHPIEEILEYFNTEYPRQLSHESLSDEQRRLIEAEYEAALEDPCGNFKEYLESAGATCEGPH